MAIPTTAATPEQMRDESLKELDRVRMMSLQALAMQRIRDSVVTLSRETGFKERPVEQFTQAPLYIPKYQQWSSTLGKIVGTAPPTAPTYVGGMNARRWAGAQSGAIRAIQILEGTYTPPPPTSTQFQIGAMVNGVRLQAGPPATPEQQYQSTINNLLGSRYGWESQPWGNYLREYQQWYNAQRNLPT